MANPWLRLWNEMPNDPKWRTIARASGQSIGNVLSVYLHLLVNASNATERGRTENVCSEDIASALDVDEQQVDAILAAMQGRVMDGDALSGWSKRQPEREDGAAERAKAWREAQKAEKAALANAVQTPPNAPERKQTLDTDKTREEEKREEKEKKTERYSDDFEISWKAYPAKPGASKAEAFRAWKARLAGGVQPAALHAGVIRYAAYCVALATEAQYIKLPATFFGPDEHYLSDWTATTAKAAPGKHAGFQNLNYRDGVTEDGSFV